MIAINQATILQTMIESAHDGIFLLDPQGIIISANGVACSICGFKSETEILHPPHKFTDFFTFYDFNDTKMPLDQLPLSRAISGEVVRDIKIKGIKKETGEVIYGVYSAIQLSDETKKTAGVILSIKDITDVTLQLRECEKYRENYQQVISSMAEGVVITDPDGTILEMNPAAMRMYKFDNLNRAVKNIHEYRETFILYDLDGNVLPVEKWPLSRAQRGEVFSNIIVEIHHRKTGTSWIANYSGTPVKDMSGKFILEVLSVQDITARKHAEEALQQYETYLSTIIEAAEEGILAVNNEGKVIKANSHFAELWKLSKSTTDEKAEEYSAMLAVASRQLIHPDIFINKNRHLFKSPEVATDVLSFKDGHILEYYSAPIPQDGTILGRVWSFRDITQRMRSEKELEESEKQLRLAMMVGSFGIYDFDIPAGKARVNDEYVAMLEYKPGEIEVTLDWWINSIHPDDRERAGSILGDCIKGKIHDYKMEFRQSTKSGKWRWILCQGKNIEYDKQCKPTRMLGTHVDITGRRQMEEDLRKERNKLTKIAASVPGVICSFRQRPDGSSHMPYASPAYLPIMGLSPEEIAEDMSPVFTAIHPDDRESVKKSIEESRRTLSPWKKEFRYFHPQKGLVWIEGHSIPQREADGSTVWHGFITDVTERKKAEDTLREERNKLTKIAAAVPGIIYAYHPRPDGSAYLPYASPVISDVLGLTPQDVAEDASIFHALIHPDDIESVRESVAEAIRTQSNWHKEFRYKHPVKGEVWIGAHSVPQRESDGSIVWYGFASDITERKQAEELLREERNKFTKIAATVPGVIFSYHLRLDGSDHMPYASPTLPDVLGFTPEEVAYDMSGVFALIHPDDVGLVRESIAKSGRTQTTWHKEFRYNHPVKGEVWIEAYSVPQFEPDGSIIWHGYGRDITDRKRAEENRKRLTRELRALSSCNEALVRVENEEELLNDICRICCEVAGYRMAWVGFEVDNGAPSIKVVARAGIGNSFVSGDTYVLENNGESPINIAMRSKKYFIIQDFEKVPKGVAWRDDALRNGHRSVITLPLLDDTGNPFGVLSIYSGEADVFAEEEIKLLEELEADLAFGIRSLRSRVERRQAQHELEHEKELSDALIDAAPGFFCVMDRFGAVLRINKNMFKLLGGSRDVFNFVYRDDFDLVTQKLKVLPDVRYIEEDIRFEIKPGDISWWRMSGHAVTIAGFVYLIISGLEITQRKQMEDNLQTTLKEREVLLQELYHRTKNNMQVISAFLAMQSIAVEDEKLQTICNDMEKRISSMALVHEKLYKSKDLTNINLQEYLNDLANLILRGFPATSEKVTLAFETERVFVTIDIAIPIGLIVTEALTNSFKYAFPDDRSGRILIRLQRHAPDELILVISDNGVGVPGKFDVEQQNTIGIPTILSIVRKQLHGRVELDTLHGFSWRISLKYKLYGKRV